MKRKDRGLTEHYNHMGVFTLLCGAEAKTKYQAGGAPGGKHKASARENPPVSRKLEKEKRFLRKRG